jgi:hypothetical protein
MLPTVLGVYEYDAMRQTKLICHVSYLFTLLEHMCKVIATQASGLFRRCKSSRYHGF